MPEQTNTAPTLSLTTRKALRIVWKVLKWSLIVLISLSIIGYALLWTPAVQRYLVNRMTSAASETWGTKFTIGSVSITPMSYFVFHDFHVEDHHQDTLLYAKTVEAAGFGFWDLWNKKIDIQRATVTDAVFQVQRLPKERNFNIDFIIDFFKAEDAVPMEDRFQFSMDTAIVHRVRFKFADASNGTSMTAKVKHIYATSTDMNIIARKIILDSAYIEQPIVRMHTHNPVPIPSDLPPSPYNLEPDSLVPPWHIAGRTIKIHDMTYNSTEPLVQQTDAHAKHNKQGNNHKKNKKSVEAKQTQKQKNKKLFAHKHKRKDKPEKERHGIFSKDGLFAKKDKAPETTGFHFKHIVVEIDDFEMLDDHFKGRFQHLAGVTPDGFEIKTLRGNFKITPKEFSITNFRLNTTNSSFGNSIIFKYNSYDDFDDFAARVKVYAELHDCKFTLADIGVFVPSLLDNLFVKFNKKTTINVDGVFRGVMKEFKLNDIDIEIGKDVEITNKQREHKNVIEWVASLFTPNKEDDKDKQQHSHSTTKKEDKEKKGIFQKGIFKKKDK